MLYRISTAREIYSLACIVPELVAEEILHYVSVLDAEYGAGRDLSHGGYILLAEDCNDVTSIKRIIDYDALLCEWANKIGNNYLSALYLLGDDYSIVVIMPIDAAPQILLDELKEKN